MKRRHPTPILAILCAAALAATASAGALAHHRPGHNPPGHAAKGYDGPAGVRGGGPPPWAPAWGYRGKQKIKYRQHGVFYEADPWDLVRLPETGLGSCNRDLIGAVLGGAVGAAAGSQIGKGDGKVLATVGGAIIGVLVGGNIGRAMDQVDQNCVGQVLERTPDGRPVVWNDPDRPGRYTVTPTRTWESGNGAYCREYQTTIVIDGREERAYGTACRQPDGSWRKV